MIWRISRNGRLKTQCTSIPRRPKHYLLPEKGYNISYVWKQQAYNYAIPPQTSPKYDITNYRVSSLIKILALKKKKKKIEYNKLSKQLGLLRLISPYPKQSHKLIFYLALKLVNVVPQSNLIILQ